ncbi:hypothetical protein KY290_013591 [Solanum tuberosum]|uniref:peroxidase n=1 Tax=Solanum tuberosum TaxID=4113 RepID=A0ABQ7VMU0_SOLTU|nr:hypothetical protein KY285_013069 [Solanum tuberosum]KAH0769610.1 hypothetical protein KY290_013591 [Solanum tuberosum]
MTSKALFFGVLLFSALSAFAEEKEDDNPGLVMDYYKRTCPQAEDIIKEQVNLLYKQQQNNAFSWLRNVFHNCFVESCDASLLLDSTREMLECHDVVSCTDIIVLSGRDGIVALGGPYIPLKTGRRDGRRSRADILEQHLPSHNESISVVLERFANIGINTPGAVALLVDPQLNPEHIPRILKKCPYSIPDTKAMQYVRNDRGTPLKLDNNYYRYILDNKGLMLVDQQLAVDKRTRLYVKKLAKSQDYFKEFARAITVLSENNPLTGTKGEIRKQ